MALDREKIDRLLESLRQKRDELRLQLHLGKAQVREEWDEAEDKWKRFEDQARRWRDTADETAGKMRETIKILAEELEDAYRRIRRTLKGGAGDER